MHRYIYTYFSNDKNKINLSQPFVSMGFTSIVFSTNHGVEIFEKQKSQEYQKTKTWICYNLQTVQDKIKWSDEPESSFLLFQRYSSTHYLNNICFFICVVWILWSFSLRFEKEYLKEKNKTKRTSFIKWILKFYSDSIIIWFLVDF